MKAHLKLLLRMIYRATVKPEDAKLLNNNRGTLNDPVCCKNAGPFQKCGS